MKDERINKELSEMLIGWYDAAVLDALSRCESPIEQLFLVGAWSTLSPVSTLSPTRAAHPNVVAVADGIRLHAQEEVGKHRIDFALFEGKRRLGIEIDGHDFHEKTKEQARNDKQRERALMAANWHVIRFAGSEVWADPQARFSEALGLLRSMEAA